MDKNLNNTEEPQTSSSEEPHGTVENNGTTQEIAHFIYKYKFWIQITAIFSIILGIILCLTIAGIIIGWIPIWLGSILRSSLKSFEIAYKTGDTLELELGIIELNRYFKICGLLIVIYLIILLGFMLTVGTGLLLYNNH